MFSNAGQYYKELKEFAKEKSSEAKKEGLLVGSLSLCCGFMGGIYSGMLSGSLYKGILRGITMGVVFPTMILYSNYRQWKEDRKESVEQEEGLALLVAKDILSLSSKGISKAYGLLNRVEGYLKENQEVIMRSQYYKL